MRGLLLGAIFFSLLPLIFFKSPYVGILLWYWISLMSPQTIVWTSIFAQFNFAFITAVATLFCWLVSREPKLPPRAPCTVLIVLMMFWLCVTTLHAIGPPDQVKTFFVLDQKMLLMTLLAYAWTTTRRRVDALVLVCVLSVTFFGLKGGVWTLLTGGQNRVYGPEGSNIADNNDLGVALTMFLPLLFYVIQRYHQQHYLKWPLIALTGFTVIGDLFTYSRGAFLALCAMGLILWSRSRQKLITGLGIIALAIAVWNFAPASLFKRFDTIGTYEQDASAESRLFVWNLSWHLALKYPILGAGLRCMYDSTTVNRELANRELFLDRPRAAHSVWFQMLGEQGFPGLTIFLLLLFFAWRDARWLVRSARGYPALRWAEDLGRTAQASIVGFAVGGTFASMAYYDGFYVLVIIIASARHVAATEIQVAASSGTSVVGSHSMGRGLLGAHG